MLKPPQAKKKSLHGKQLLPELQRRTAPFLRLSAVRLNADELACPLNQSSVTVLLHKTNKTQVTRIMSHPRLKLLINAVQ